MARFDNIDLGQNRAMERIISANQKRENELIELCAKTAEPFDQCAADAIRTLKHKNGE